MRNTGAKREFGSTDDSRYYFNLSKPGQYFGPPNQPAYGRSPQPEPPLGPGHAQH